MSNRNSPRHYYRSNLHHHHSSRTTNEIQPNENYQCFHIKSDNYNRVIINNDTSINTWHEVLAHVSDCTQYSMDTESDRRTNELALIQVNTIPHSGKSWIMLIELNHLSTRNSSRYEKVFDLFRLIFREANEIYSWGDMAFELEPAKELLAWPIRSKLINLQPRFSSWYNWARTRCRVSNLIVGDDDDDDYEFIQQQTQPVLCTCHRSSPYKSNELWSLKNALRYAGELSLDKSARMSNWGAGLTSNNSSLSGNDRSRMIDYATHDVLAVSFLIRPVIEKWTFEQVKNRRTSEIFTVCTSVNLPVEATTTSRRKKIKNIDTNKLSKIFAMMDSDAEFISSDEEIYLNQIIESSQHNRNEPDDNKENNQELININPDAEKRTVDINSNEVNVNDRIRLDDERLDDEQMNVDNRDVVVDEVNVLPVQNPQNQQQQRKQRSETARKRRNRKRNTQQRLSRYRYPIYRHYYYKVTARMARRILRYYHVHIRHIKRQGESYVIGVHDDQARIHYEHDLPRDCFNREHFERFRR